MKYKWTKQEVRNQTLDYLDTLKEWKEVIILISTRETKEMRTLWQNNFFYWLLTWIAKETQFSSDEIKQYILWEVFWQKEVLGRILNNKTKSSKLSTKEAWSFIRWIQEFCYSNEIKMKYVSREDQALFLTYN